MNAHTFEYDLTALSERAERADNDRWARIQTVARVISDAAPDLDDVEDVVRTLYEARFCYEDFGDVIDEAIEQARLVEGGSR